MKYISNKDKKVSTKPDYSKALLLGHEDFSSDGHLLQEVTIPPQTKQRRHYHHIQTEVFYILEGECIININDQDYFAKPGDAFICSPKDQHFLWNKSVQEFKLVVFKINLPVDNDDTVWVEDLK